MKKKIFTILCGLLLIPPAWAGKTPRLLREVDEAAMNRWVDSVMQQMSVPERIGQLFVVGIETDLSESNKAQLKNLIEECHVGGLLFSKGTAPEQALLTNLAQSLSRVPLLITMDGEWGLAMRLKDTPTFPHNMALGAVTDDSLIYAYGREMGRACRRMGIHTNFAPVIDVNSNPANPVIGIRSFGENPDNVSRKARLYAQGLEDEGIMAVGKHFPGHGDTYEDSHLTLPSVLRDRAQLDSCDLLVFQRYIDAGFSGLMVAHLLVPALDSTSGHPTSLSSKIVTDLLQKEMGFEGLIFTDALEMKGAVSTTPCLDALMAGNDILLKPLHPKAQFDLLVQRYEEGGLSKKIIDRHCRKVLQYKYVLGLNHRPEIEMNSLSEDLNNVEAKKLIRELSAQAITALKNNEEVLPFTHLGQSRFGVVTVGRQDAQPFVKRLQEYAPIEYVERLYTGLSDAEIKDVSKHIAQSNKTIIALFSTQKEDIQLAQKILGNAKGKVLLFFTTPYAIPSYDKLVGSSDAVIVAYENTSVLQECAAEALFGGLATQGRLPVSVGDYPQGSGLYLPECRLGHAFPEEVGLDSRVLGVIDSIVKEGIDSAAFPGCQIIITRHEKIVYDRAFGYFDYEKTHPVTPEDLYDLASITKVMGTLPAIMWLNDHEQVSLNAPLCFYLPEMRDYGLSAISLRQTLMHESGLPSGISLRRLLIDPDSYTAPLLKWGRDNDYPIQVDKNWYIRKDYQLKPWLIQDKAEDSFPVHVADGLYASASLSDSIWHTILSVSRTDRRYRYSDLNFIILQKLAERVSGESLDRFIEQRLLRPIGAYHLVYHPQERFPLQNIAPTEIDSLFHRQLVVGYPHDELACFMGGVSGNAGLFSNALDMAKMLQMLQNGGTYGLEDYFEPTTVRLFTTEKSHVSRRGLGFDKPDADAGKSPTCPEAPLSVYGHTGYTGTAFWVDPDNDIIYIFLCNRVYPHRWNTRLTDMNIRTRIQSVIYQSLLPQS
ncbi:MAG: serine hydrolase [Porphyromonadaceae bacterium]|nr:serine hydrolase [Porphyromonadaceae bacterium]